MIKAVPVNKKGDATGPAQSFSDAQWNKMKSHFGKNLAWKEVVEVKKDGIEVKSGIREVELIAPVSTKRAKRKYEK